jgi:protein O-mannosyl-transferase
MFTYPRWSVDAGAAWQYLYPLGLVALVAALWARRARTRAPLASLLLFGGSLFPVLGFFNIYPFRYSYVADHFQYLASIAIIVPVAAVLTRLVERPVAAPGRAAGRFAVVMLVTVLAFLTWRQSATYHDAVTLYRATLERNPDSFKEQNNLGVILARSQRTVGDAIPHFEAAVRLKPDHVRAQYSLALALFLSGREAESEPHFRRVLELAPGSALLAGNSHFFLGEILMKEPRRLSEARVELEEARRLKPDDPEVRQKLGEVSDLLRRPR